MRGHLRGYKIQTWTDKDSEEVRDINILGNQTKAIITKFIPYRKNYAKIMAYNGR